MELAHPHEKFRSPSWRQATTEQYFYTLFLKWGRSQNIIHDPWKSRLSLSLSPWIFSKPPDLTARKSSNGQRVVHSDLQTLTGQQAVFGVCCSDRAAGFFLGLKRPDRAAERIHPSSFAVTKEWSRTCLAGMPSCADTAKWPETRGSTDWLNSHTICAVDMKSLNISTMEKIPWLTHKHFNKRKYNNCSKHDEKKT
jgi:hypothetical protein